MFGSRYRHGKGYREETPVPKGAASLPADRRGGEVGNKDIKKRRGDERNESN